MTNSPAILYSRYMQNGISIKPGIATTEFWSMLITSGIGVLVFTQVLPAEKAPVIQNDLLQFVSLCVQIFTLASAAYITIKPVITYIKGRVTLKSQLLAQQIGIVNK